MKHHIKNLKKHRNVLYVFVTVLFIFHIITFIVLSSYIARLHIYNENEFRFIKNSVEDLRLEQQFKINELTRFINEQREEFNRTIINQKGDFTKEIEMIKLNQKDFSGIIENSLKAVVSISTDKSSASGFIVRPDGYIVTNKHVIENARIIKVLTYNNKIHNAIIIGTDDLIDVAILKIEGNFSNLHLANSNDTNIGERVIAIGNPLGLSFSVTQGIVSGLKRKGPNNLNIYIQTDVTLNQGNSGGPLINTKGEVIGMNNFKIGGAEGLGFALESNSIKSSFERITSKVTT